MNKQKQVVWIARILVAIVTFLNLQAAFAFMLHPENFYQGFELTGEPGVALIRGMGLLFLMWNIPYLVAVWHPLRHFTSLVEAVVMQAIGVLGESILLFTLPGEHPVLESSVLRFIYFDGSGLLVLLIALLLVFTCRRNSAKISH